MQMGRDRRREATFDNGTVVCLRFSGLENISFGKFTAMGASWDGRLFAGGFSKRVSRPHNGQDLFRK
jgi:hypothetical protein